MGSQLWCYISLSRYIFQVCKMLHLSGSTFRHGALISSYISKLCLRDTNEMGSQLWCYISLSRHIIQVCEMLHLSGSTFRHGALFSSYICKWWLLHVDSEYLENSVYPISLSLKVRLRNGLVFFDFWSLVPFWTYFYVWGMGAKQCWKSKFQLSHSLYC